MKKALLILFSFLLLFGCETQEERDKRKKDEEIQKITEELTKSETPEEAKDWLISNKMGKVVTIFCLTTSKKCESLKSVSEEIKEEYELEIYFFNFDEIEDDVKNVYKTTYKLDDYTGYLPYILIINKNKLISTHTDTFNKEDLENYLKENKIIN